MKHLIIYQIKYEKVHDSFKFSNFQYTTAINVKTKDVFILHERFLLSINQVAVCSSSGVSSLKNSDNETLSVPKSNTATYGDRCFSVAAPKLWNSLPGNFRYIENLCTFKTSIKTWLFKSAFNLT